jgi:hypothetical protein
LLKKGDTLKAVVEKESGKVKSILALIYRYELWKEECQIH